MAYRTIGPKSQTELLKDHFMTKPSISGHEARGMYRIDSLPRRILDLETQGHKFFKEPKRDQTGKRYTRYHYLGQGFVEQPTSTAANFTGL
jgi:hypothetical protein